MSYCALALTVLAQLPAHVAATSVVMRGSADWLIVSNTGVVEARFTDIDGQVPTSMALLADRSRVAFTAHRENKLDGLFIKTLGGGVTELSISNGYHAWVAASPTGDSLVFAHHPGEQSGPIGAHAAMQNAQLWRLRLDGGTPEQLTVTPGCKAGPAFVSENLIAFGHNSCRGTQGMESLALGPNRIQRVITPQEDHFDEQPRVSTDGRFVAFARKHFGAHQIWVARWPSLAEQHLAGELDAPQPFVSFQWLTPRVLAFVSNDEVMRVAVTDHELRPISPKPQEKKP